MKTGVLGGTFDPVHNGHLAIAEEVRWRLGLEEVLFIPTGQPYLRTNGPVLPAEHRLEMVRRAIAGRPRFKVSEMEIERAGPSYTVDTITELREGLNYRGEIYFILGWDKLSEFPGWKQPARLLELCSLAAVPRPGCAPPDLKSLDAVLPGMAQGVILFRSPFVDISASDIRERVRCGQSIKNLVPGAVSDYIREHGLYTD